MLRKLACWMLLALALTLHSVAHSQGCNNRFVVFGDSLSDPGNDYLLFGQTAKAPFSPLPSAPYSIGGHHFSNGMTWAEQVANAIGSPLSGAPAELNSLNTNFAFGGARARPNGPEPDIDLTAQVGLFSGRFHQACPNALYIFWLGGFDLLDALKTLVADPSGAAAVPVIGAAVASIAQNIGALAATGARKFVVFDAPDVSKAPLVSAQTPQVRAAAAIFSQQFNVALGNAIQQLQQQGIDITRFDPDPLISDVVEDPAAFGLVNGTTPCLTFGVVARAICQAPPHYFFWDGIHPTAAGHRLLAGVVKSEIFH